MADGFERLAAIKAQAQQAIGQPNPTTGLPDARIRLADAKRKYQLSQGGQFSAGGAMARSGVATMLDTMLGMPNNAAIAVNKLKGDKPPFSVSSYYTGNQPPQAWDQNYDWGDQIFPQPSSNDIFGAAQNLGETAAAFVTGDPTQMRSPEQQRNQQALLTEQARAEHPVAAGFGDVAAQGLFLAAGRSPIVKQNAISQIQQTPLMKSIAAKGPALNATDEIDEIFGAFRRVATDSNFSKWLQRSGLKMGEAGAEGYVMSVLQGNASPEETALFAAGMQGAGNVFIGSIGAMLGKNPTLARATAAALVGAAAFQYADSALPGGNDYILPNIEAGFNKVAALVGLGAMFGLAGYGRINSGQLAERAPLIADALTSVPRGVVNGVYNAMKQDRKSQIVINQFVKDPSFFGPTAQRRLERALTDEKISLTETVESLLDDSDFRKKYNEIN